MPWEKALWGSDGMLWARTYSDPPGRDLLPSAVKELEVRLDVINHSVCVCVCFPRNSNFNG